MSAEASIFVSSHSFRKPAPPLPAAPPPPPPFNSMDLSVPIDLAGSNNQEKRQADFDTWGQDYIVSIHELQVRFDGANISRAFFLGQGRFYLFYRSLCP